MQESPFDYSLRRKAQASAQGLWILKYNPSENDKKTSKL